MIGSMERGAGGAYAVTAVRRWLHGAPRGEPGLVFKVLFDLIHSFHIENSFLIAGFF
jgi:hypothetical protein